MHVPDGAKQAHEDHQAEVHNHLQLECKE